MTLKQWIEQNGVPTTEADMQAAALNAGWVSVLPTLQEVVQHVDEQLEAPGRAMQLGDALLSAITAQVTSPTSIAAKIVADWESGVPTPVTQSLAAMLLTALGSLQADTTLAMLPEEEVMLTYQVRIEELPTTEGVTEIATELATEAAVKAAAQANIARNDAATAYAQQVQAEYRQQLEAWDGTGKAPAYVEGGD